MQKKQININLNIWWNRKFSFRRKQAITHSLNRVKSWQYTYHRYHFAELSLNNVKGSSRFNSIFLVHALGVRILGLKQNHTRFGGISNDFALKYYLI